MSGTVSSRKLHAAIRGAALAALLVLSSAPATFAQTNTAGSLPANRWLLIVETSRAMEPRAPAALQMINMLILSGMNGQMHPGDTLGVWTYNEELNARSFDLQTWAPASSRTVATRVISFLQAQKFQKKGRFVEKVRPAMQAVFRNSDFITVVLISDGQEKIQGTPYDAEINKYYETWGGEQEKARLPFLTLLRAERDRITAYTVNAPPWPLELPPLPAALLPPKPAPVVQAPPPQAVIFTGKKPAPGPTQNVVQLPLTVPEPSLPATNLSVASAATPAQPGASRPTAAGTAAEISQPAAVTYPATSSSRDAKPLEAPAQAAQKAAVPADAGAGRHVALPNELVVAARPDPDAVSAPAARSTNVAVRRTPTAVSAPAVSAMPPRTFWSRKWVWIVSAAGLVGVVLVLVLRARQRARAPLQVSLITRSLDGKKK